MSTQLKIVPHISEKAYAQSQNATYVFKVPVSANKQQVAEAVEAQYGVKVADIRVVIAKGKRKKTIRNGKPYEGFRNDAKKAYVTLVEGDSIKIFDEIEEEKK